MTQFIGEAPGKVLLIGEHAVVYGHPAIAIPVRGVQARVEVELTRHGGMELLAPDLQGTDAMGSPADKLAPLVRLAHSVLELFGEAPQGLRLVVQSTIPIGHGMGSGAAVSVAIVKGICAALGRSLTPDQVAELAMEAEREFHGNPSGVDSAVVARNEPIYFVRGKPPQAIAVGNETFRFLIADTGIPSPTYKVVNDVKALRDREPARVDSYLWELGSMVSVAREIIRTGSAQELGVCMNHSHSILRELGVSSSDLDRLVETAVEKGGLGAKLTGAGRGGAMIALLGNATDEERLSAELRLAGAQEIYSTTLGGT